jgi:(p)ppGpp synthase/HD superfamily hydrolase
MSYDNNACEPMENSEKLYPTLAHDKECQNGTEKRLTVAQGLALVTKAADFAARRHRSQKRKDGRTPYINHPVGVAYLLTEIGKVDDPVTLAAAYLHDTVEDTKTTFDELEQEFGSEICEIVRECTDDKSLSSDQRKKLQVENAGKHCYQARLIHLADKLYNLQDATRKLPIGWTPEYAKRYFTFTKDVVSQIRGTNEALEAQLDDVINTYLSKH